MSVSTKRMIGIVGIVITAALVLPVATALGGPEPLPHCQFEDGSGSELPCQWDPAVDGNRIGGDAYIVSAS